MSSQLSRRHLACARDNSSSEHGEKAWARLITQSSLKAVWINLFLKLTMLKTTGLESLDLLSLDLLSMPQRTPPTFSELEPRFCILYNLGACELLMISSAVV